MYEFLDYLTEDAMTREVVTLSPTATVAEAEALFEKYGFNGAPLVDARGEYVGWLSKLDLLKAFRFSEDHMFPPYEEIMRRPVGPLASDRLLSATPRMRLTRVLERLVTSGVKSLPVISDRRVVGVISREDVLSALRRAARGERARDPVDA
jgi:CBS domain-containing protein